MGSKGGGGYDVTPVVEQGQQSLALQEQIYNDSVDRGQPFYDVGVSGLGALADLMGLQGGSVMTEDQIRNNLAPQFTTETNTGGPNQYTTPDGQVLTIDNPTDYFNTNLASSMLGGSGMDQVHNDEQALQFMTENGYSPYQNSQTVVDNEGLNAAVQEQFNSQQNPDNFGSLLQSFGMDQFQADPGYQFRLDEGNKALERAAAARGEYYDPSTVKALGEYNAGMADQTYGDAYNRYNNDQNNIFNRLAAISGVGQTANQSLNQQGAQYGAAADGVYSSIANAQVESNAASAAQPSMFDTLLGAGVQLGSAFLSDIRLKKNIEYVATENGHKIYEFDYRDGSGRFRGVMAQEVLEAAPEAVVRMPNGHLAVDYARLGLEMTEVV